MSDSRSGQRSLLVALLAAAWLAAACTREEEPKWEPAATRGPTQVEVMRGVLSEWSPGTITLTPCRVNMLLDVEDGTGGSLETARAQLASGPRREMFVEMRVERGVRSDDWRTEKDRLLVALELLRAMPVGQADWCKTVLAPGSTRASGNEPFWSVTMSPDGIEWNEPELAAPLRFPAVAPLLDGEKRTWISTLSIEGGTPRELRVVVIPSTCVDSMSAAWHPASAEITLDGRVMSGCAHDGE